MTEPAQTTEPVAAEPTAAAASQLPLPSKAGLLKATAIAAGIAAALLVFVVLPAEYNIDPTGLGGAIGLTRLSAPPPTTTPPPETSNKPATGKERKDTVVVEVPAGKGVEYKFAIKKDDRMVYDWKADSGTLFFDFHGEPKGAAKDVFESFAISTASKARGTFTAPFDGVHGWYWKNRGTSPVKVTLKTSGTYTIKKLQ